VQPGKMLAPDAMLFGADVVAVAWISGDPVECKLSDCTVTPTGRTVLPPMSVILVTLSAGVRLNVPR